MKQVEFLFEYGSPFSYLASTQMTALVRNSGASVIYRPILLGAVLKATGNSSPMTVPAKGKYMGIELRRWAARYGVAFRPNPHLLWQILFASCGAQSRHRNSASLPPGTRQFIGPFGPKHLTWEIRWFSPRC
jgi:2-hydroxychromene-2-carboxylate isomerase